MKDEEWGYFEPFLVQKRGRRPRNHRLVLDAVFWMMRSGAPWRAAEFGEWNSIWRRFRRWAENGVWDAILEALGVASYDGRLSY
jgi:transposase